MTTEPSEPNGEQDWDRLAYWQSRPRWARVALTVLGAYLVLALLIISIAVFSVTAPRWLLPGLVISSLVVAIAYLVVYLGPGRPPQH